MERRGGIELREAAGGLPHAWPANTHYEATPLPTTSGFLRYFRACSLSPVRQGTPRVPQGTWGVLWERNVCPYWMLMEFPISLYVVVGLLAHIPIDMFLSFSVAWILRLLDAGLIVLVYGGGPSPVPEVIM